MKKMGKIGRANTMQSRVEVGMKVTLPLPSPPTLFRRVNIRAEMVAAKGLVENFRWGV